MTTRVYKVKDRETGEVVHEFKTDMTGGMLERFEAGIDYKVDHEKYEIETPEDREGTDDA